MRLPLAMTITLLLASCAISRDGMAGHDQPVGAYPWCAGELRDAASQPMPANASAEERRLMREYHVSAGYRRGQQEQGARIDTGRRAPQPPRP